MGNKPERYSMKSHLGWRAVEWVGRALDPREREVVLGDFAESGEPWNRALWGVLGLAARREAAAWMSVRPLIVLVAIVIPLGLLISVLSRITSGATSVYLWMYANNSDWDLIKSAGFWYVLTGASFSFFTQCLALFCSAWTIGFVIGSVSGKYVRNTVSALLLLLLVGEFSLAPRYLAFCWQLRNKLFHVPALAGQNDPVSANLFYVYVFPLIVQIALVAAPAWWGVVAGMRLRILMPLFRVCVWCAAITTLATLVIRQPGFGLLFYRHPLFWLEGAVRALQLVIYWPILYLLALGTQTRLATKAT